MVYILLFWRWLFYRLCFFNVTEHFSFVASSIASVHRIGSLLASPPCRLRGCCQASVSPLLFSGRVCISRWRRSAAARGMCIGSPSCLSTSLRSRHVWCSTECIRVVCVDLAACSCSASIVRSSDGPTRHIPCRGRAPHHAC